MGFAELVVIGIIALIFIGPKQLPEMARVVGRLINEFKRATGDLTGSLVRARNNADEMLRTNQEKIKTEIAAAEEANAFPEEKLTPENTLPPPVKEESEGKSGV